MAPHKESSTNHQNKQLIENQCPVTFTLNKIGGRWKPIILFHLFNHPSLRYGQLRKFIPAITEKMLIQQLRELEVDKLVNRDVKPVVPPHVAYSLTEIGRTMDPILSAMAEWGLRQAVSLTKSAVKKQVV